MKKIPLNKSKAAMVDDDDYRWLTQWKWRLDTHGYAIRNSKKERIPMHRVINKTPRGMDTDHIDGNPLNNRKKNLRSCTTSQNCMNRRSADNTSSKYKGVTWHKRIKKWQAQIISNGMFHYLGIYSSEEVAAKAYNNAAAKLHGKFAKLNEVNI